MAIENPDEASLSSPGTNVSNQWEWKDTLTVIGVFLGVALLLTVIILVLIYAPKKQTPTHHEGYANTMCTDDKCGMNCKDGKCKKRSSRHMGRKQ